MSKTDIKAAMDLLRVSMPLKLAAKAPVFRAPRSASLGVELSQDRNGPRDQNQSEDVSTSQDSRLPRDNAEFSKNSGPEMPTRSSQDVIQSQDENESRDANTSLDSIPPEDIGPTQDPFSSEVSSPSHKVARASQPRRATEQDRAVTEIASVKDRLSTGYTRVPNSILMQMVGGGLSRSEIKIALLIARMTISFNRPMVPLSKGVIERMTGVQGRAVLEALQELERGGVIRKVPGSHKQPNRLGLIFDETFGGKPSSGEKPPQGGKGTHTQDSNSSQRWGENRPYKKDTLKNNQKSLSVLTEEIAVQTYLDTLKPARKRESERLAFQELRADYSDADVSECLAIVQRQGVHSPMAFLSKAMSDVLAQVQVERGKAQAAAEQERARTERVARDFEIAQANEREWETKEKAFNRAFPDEERKREAVREFCKGMPFKADSPVGRNFALGRWYAQLSQYERSELA